MVNVVRECACSMSTEVIAPLRISGSKATCRWRAAAPTLGTTVVSAAAVGRRTDACDVLYVQRCHIRREQFARDATEDGRQLQRSGDPAPNEFE